MNLTGVLFATLGTALAVILFVHFVGLQFPGKHTYTEIEIEAPVEAVWQVLIDNVGYPNWNPYHVQVEGSFTVGEPLVVNVHKPNGEDVVVKPHVLRVEANRELTWGGGIQGIFYGEHVFLLEATPSGHTHLIHKEDFTGIAVQFVPLEAIDEGYAQMNQALKMVVESA